MTVFAAALGILFLIAFIIERWVAGRGRQIKRQEHNNLRHITGARPWWREAPRDPPEGDH